MRQRRPRVNGIWSNTVWLTAIGLLASCGSRSAAELSSLSEGAYAGTIGTGGTSNVSGTMGRAGSSTRYPEGLGGVPSVAGARSAGGTPATSPGSSGGTTTRPGSSGGNPFGGAAQGGDGGAGGDPNDFPPDCRGGRVLVDLKIESDEQLAREMRGRTHVVGTLALTSTVHDLEPLRCLQRVEDLVIEDAPRLRSLRGLEQLTEVDGGVKLINLPALSDFEAIRGLVGVPHLHFEGLPGLATLPFERLTHVDTLLIRACPKLVDLSGLAGLQTLLSLDLHGNAALSSLEGLNHLTGIEDLTLDSNPALQSLNALSALERISSALVIRGNSGLKSLRGLQSLESVAELVIQANAALENLIGLSALQQVGSIDLQHNPRLVDLTGLVALNGYLATNVLIRDNPGLTSLVGLHGVRALEDLDLEANPLLMDLRGLDQLEAVRNLTLTQLRGLRALAGLGELRFVKGDLSIVGNETLTDLRPIEQLFSIGSFLKITDNASLPTCRAEWLRDQIGVDRIGTDSTSPPPHYQIAGNDDAGTCTR